jgi:hypothetical protein
MLVPALGFANHEWLHLRIALVHGVGAGLTTVRAADAGRLTVAGPHGQVVGESGAMRRSLKDAEVLAQIVRESKDSNRRTVIEGQ